MKTLKSRLLLTVLSPLVLSLSWVNIANAGTLRYSFRNGGYIDLTCRIDNNQSKVVEATGKLGNISSANLAIQAQNKGLIKRSIPIAQNGDVNFSKILRRKNITRIYLIGSITHSDYSYEKVYGLGTFCN